MFLVSDADRAVDSVLHDVLRDFDPECRLVGLHRIIDALQAEARELTLKLERERSDS